MSAYIEALRRQTIYHNTQPPKQPKNRTNTSLTELKNVSASSWKPKTAG